MNSFIFRTTGTIHNEFGSSSKLGELILSAFGKTFQKKRILFVTDKGILDMGLAEKALQNLKDQGFEYHLFSDFSADPAEKSILDGAESAKSIQANLVIGFGGGSSMDTAKLISLLASSRENLDDIYGVNLVQGKRLPLILVPTTAGTGSEVTPISIVTTGEMEKKGVVSPVLLPDMALLDASLTLDLPASVTAATGIDAMVHAIEAYTSINPNNNPISRTLAKEALTLLGANIRNAVFEGKNAKSRSAMLLGSLLAGQAFANSPVAAVHALAYPIGGQFHVPHGLSNALVLPHVMRFNLLACEKQYAQLAPLVFPDIFEKEQINDTAEEFIEQTASLSAGLGLQTTLREVGISESNIDSLAKDAMHQTRLLVNNPRSLTYEDAHSIYSKAL